MPRRSPECCKSVVPPHLATPIRPRRRRPFHVQYRVEHRRRRPGNSVDQTVARRQEDPQGQGQAARQDRDRLQADRRRRKHDVQDGHPQAQEAQEEEVALIPKRLLVHA